MFLRISTVIRSTIVCSSVFNMRLQKLPIQICAIMEVSNLAQELLNPSLSLDATGAFSAACSLARDGRFLVSLLGYPLWAIQE